MPSRRSTLLAYIPLAALVAGLGAMIDFGLGDRNVDLRALTVAFGLGVGSGALLGLAFAACLGLLRRAPWWAQWIAWAAFGVLVGTWLIDQLGVLARLEGEDRGDALIALGASVGAGSLATLLGVIAQPAGALPAWLLRRPRRPLWAAPLLALVGAGIVVADRIVGVESYAAAHTALRIAGALLFTILAFVIASRWPARLMPPTWGKALGVVALAVPLVWGIGTVSGDRDVLAGLLARPLSGMALRTLREFADFDRDGYSPILGGTDCAPFDASIHPFAREIRGNGIDENCKLGDAPLLTLPADPPLPEGPSPRSVVLITIDTLRADTTSWGGARDTTPNMAAWSKGATRFTRAYTGGGWTSLALSSLFRGVYPRRLTWVRFFETNRFRLLRTSESEDLKEGEELKLRFGLPSPDTYVPLQTYLKRRGMATAAVIDDGSTGFLDQSSGAYPDFDEYREVSGRSRDVAVTDAAIEILGGFADDQRFFLWVHYFGPHVPHTWHRGVQRWGESVADKYAHEVAWTDKQVGRLLEAIDGREGGQEIAVVITSDHGETFRRTRRIHGVELGEDDIQVPLVVRGPGFDPGSCTSLVSTVDVMPTILALTETPGPEGIDGVDLARVLAMPSSVAGRILFAETWRYTASERPTHNLVVAFNGTRKVIYNLIDQAVTARRQPRDSAVSITDPQAVKLQRALDEYLEQTGEPLFVD